MLFVPGRGRPGVHPRRGSVAKKADAGCGRLQDYKRIKSPSATTLLAQPFTRPRPGDPLTSQRPDLYEGVNEFKKCDPKRNCGANLANYQTPKFATDEALVAESTTGTFNGGLPVRAIIPRTTDGNLR
jgi:hypothetical protein